MSSRSVSLAPRSWLALVVSLTGACASSVGGAMNPVDAGRDAQSPVVRDVPVAQDSSPPVDVASGPCVLPTTDAVAGGDVLTLRDVATRSAMRVASSGERFGVFVESGPARGDGNIPLLATIGLREGMFDETLLYSLATQGGIDGLHPITNGFLAVARAFDGAEGVPLRWQRVAPDPAVVSEYAPGSARFAEGAAVLEGRMYFATFGAAPERFRGVTELRTGLVETGGIALPEHPVEGSFEEQARDPQVIAGPSGVYMTFRTNTDFPYMVMLVRLDPRDGRAVGPAYWGPGCGVNSYQAIDLGDEFAVVADCMDSVTLAIGREGRWRQAQIARGMRAEAVPASRLAWNGRSLGVAFWEPGRRAPSLRFVSRDAATVSGVVRIPEAAVRERTLRGMDITSLGTSWGVGFTADSDATPGWDGTGYFARVGRCGTNAPGEE